AQLMVGKTLDELGVYDQPLPTHVAVKESVFPFNKFPGVDTILGPEMRSTGEVMGVSLSVALAFGKAISAAGARLPSAGCAFISVQPEDKQLACLLARRLRNLGFSILATHGTAEALARAHVPAERVNKVAEGSPHIVDAIRDGRVQLVINTTHGAKAIRDSYSIRRNTLQMGIPYFTTVSAAVAAVDALEANAVLAEGQVSGVRSIQEWHARMLQSQ